MSEKIAENKPLNLKESIIQQSLITYELGLRAKYTEYEIIMMIKPFFEKYKNLNQL